MNEYKDYTSYIAIMISYDRLIFNEKSAVRAKMIQYAKFYKELHIIIFSTQKFEQEDISENCTIYSTDSFSRWTYVSGAYKIGKKIIRDVDKDDSILITCQDPFETGLVGKCLANLRKNSELLLQIHTDLFSPYFTLNSILNKIRLFISKFTLPQADVVRVVSKRIVDSLLERGFKREEIILKPIDVNVDAIRNGIPSFDLHQKFPQFRKIALMVSRLESEKNIEMAIEAWKMVTLENPDFGLIIVGSGRLLNRLQKLAYKLDLSQKVAFVGWQTDIVPYYKGCDVFLVTSWYEGYGMVFKEAEAAGCKIVSTDVGIARDVGASIAEHSAQSISQELSKVLI